MNIIIAGSRSFEDYDYLKQSMESLSYIEVDEIVSGGASGADALGERYANENHINLRTIPADWDTYGKSAGPIRNALMGDYADMLVLFYDGESPGSTNMRNYMRKLKKPIYTFFTDKSGSSIENGIQKPLPCFEEEV